MSGSPLTTPFISSPNGVVHGDTTTPLDSLKKLFPALSMALLTTVAAYLMLLIAPFPGLQQLAVFAAAGLSAACMTVMCWYPYLSKRLPVGPTPGLALIFRWLLAWRSQKAVRIGLPSLILLVAAGGIAQLKINDDIADLQSLPAALQQQEQQIAALTGQTNDQKWLVVYGENAEQTLQRLEALRPKLAQAKTDGVIDGYRMLGLPSQAQQQRDLTLLRQRAPQIVAQLEQAGIRVSVPDLRPQTVDVPMWLNSVISQGWRLLWLSLPDGSSATLIPVSGVHDSAAMAALANPRRARAGLTVKRSSAISFPSTGFI